jgi:glucose/mannose-6-phosphate isomerase
VGDAQVSTIILDDAEKMRKIDKSDMLKFCVDMAKHYRESAKNDENITFDYATPENIVVAGMGGSGIGGELLKDYARDRASVPIEVSKDYQLPAYVDKRSLVLLVSYSGETEETLSAFLDAIEHKCMVYCVSSGGTLLKYAEKLNVPHLQVRGEMPPRAALPHMFAPLLTILEKTGMASGVSEELSEATKLLEKVSKENAPERKTAQNFSKALAAGLSGITPVVYGFGYFRGVAMRWKQQFNENSKVPAKWEVFSELNHNEIVGWENAAKLGKNYASVFIRDKMEPAEVRSRIEITKALMQPSVSKTFEVCAQGKSQLAKMLSTICIGDFTSVYLALQRKVDPTPVKTISLLKEKIEQSGARAKVIRQLEALAK